MTVLLALAAPASAQTFTPPEGCRLEMTVQLASCRVAQHYRCDFDPQGDQRVAYFTETGGPVHLSHIDAETRWLETRDPLSGLIETLAEEPDAASLSVLLATGRDDYDFWIVTSDGLRLHHQGHDRLTGEVVRIDGIDLLATAFSVTTSTEDGTPVYTRKGGQFVSPDHGRFYGGREEWRDWSGATGTGDDSPRGFALPGDPGFGALVPVYGCDLQVAAR